MCAHSLTACLRLLPLLLPFRYFFAPKAEILKGIEEIVSSSGHDIEAARTQRSQVRLPSQQQHLYPIFEARFVKSIQ